MPDHSFSGGRDAVPVESLIKAMRDLANPVHWKVLACLTSGPKSVEVIASLLRTEQAAVSKSLARLRTYGLVEYERRKNFHVYGVRDGKVTLTADRCLAVAFQALDGSRMTLEVSLAGLSIPDRPGGIIEPKLSSHRPSPKKVEDRQ